MAAAESAAIAADEQSTGVQEEGPLVGLHVTLQGLQSKPELNGRTGIAEGMDPVVSAGGGERRYYVVLDGIESP